jgi:Zn-dependent peptidase ImmA (M78 family)/DNA-binding XRE family transcriptional regulator
MSLPEARATAVIFEPQRLQVARQLRRQTRTALAEQLDVSPAAVSQWEAGNARPKPQTLMEISRVLKFPVRFFGGDGSPLPSPDTNTAFFRSLRKSRQIDREAAMAHACLIAELVRVIERHANLPSLDIPEYPIELDAPWDDIEAAAQSVRTHWELDNEPIEDMVRELERHGAIAVRLRLANDVDAFSWPQEDRPIVILAADKGKKDRSRFDAAHELGHLVMHAHQPEPGNRDLEKQAHRFAGAFLLPADQLIAEWPKGRLSWNSLLQLKQRWQMSLAALLYRGRDLELLTQTGYESAVRYMSRTGWRVTEPGDLGPPERPRLLRSAMSALDQVGITIHELADQANLQIEDVQEYLNGLAARGRVNVDV